MTLFVLRHGETPWSKVRKHTGRSDVPLTDSGRAAAANAGLLLRRLRGDMPWALVLSSPLARAQETAQLAGLHAKVDDRLQEWDYGDYDGRTSDEITRERPGWDLWRDGCPGGEQIADVAARVDDLLTSRISPALPRGDVIVIAHSHLLRVLVARWLGFSPDTGRHFVLDAAHLGLLGTEHTSPALLGWNIGPS